MMGLTFEETFDPVEPRRFIAERWYHALLYIGGYIAVVFIGRHVMRTKQAYNLRPALILWNAILAIFSIIGTVHIMPEFISTLRQNGFQRSYCEVNDDYYTGVNGFWVLLFHLSKVLELGDTVFLILRKRPVIFLHWYHHASVVFYTWLTYPVNTASTRWGVGMNFTVHAFMYVYYTLTAAGYRLPKMLSMSITSLQIVQFIIGTWVTGHSFVLSLTGQCQTSVFAATLAVIMYVSYLFLFMNFFYRTYMTGRSKQRVE